MGLRFHLGWIRHVYIINGWSSTHANQATTMGMGIMVNGERTFSETNQAIYGPASVDYVLDNSAVSIRA